MQAYTLQTASPFNDHLPHPKTNMADACSYSFSPLSSPQITPTLESVASFVSPSYFPQFGRDRTVSSSSIASDASFAMTDASPSSSISSLSSFGATGSCLANEEEETCIYSAPIASTMARNSSCYYAASESLPTKLALANNARALGGTGMVRSFSNPVQTTSDFQERQAAFLAEARAIAAAVPGARRPSYTTDSIDDFLPRTPSPWSARNLVNFPQTSRPSTPTSPTRQRPGLGRFQSFEPALLATEFARSTELFARC